MSYTKLTVSILLLVSLFAASQALIADDEVVAVDIDIPTIDPRLKKICDTLDHLKKDFKRYFDLYKKLAERFKSNRKLKGNNKCRDELNRMFTILKHLMDLINRMEEIKEKLQWGSDEVIQELERWIIRILNMVADLADIAEAVLACDKKASATKEMVIEFRRLNAQCLDVSQNNLLVVMEGEVAASLQTATSASGSLVATLLVWQSPIPDFWAKIMFLRRLCHRLIQCFIQIRNALLESGIQYPYREMQKLCGCLVKICQSAWKLMQIRMQSSQMTPHDLEKALCEWLMELMEVRVILMDYYNDLIIAVKKLSVENPEAGDKLIQFIRKCMGGIFQELDDCLLKLQCWYIDMVQEGGPKRIQIVIDRVDTVAIE